MEEGAIKNGEFYPNGSDKGEPLVDVEYSVNPGGPFGNFVDCIRSRKQEDLNAEIEIGHYSSAHCHLGNISYRLGEDVPFEDRPQVFQGNSVVSDSLQTVLANTEALGVKPEEATYRLGPKLDFDADSERFVDNDKANQLLTRDYRDPFVVPNEV